VSQLLFSLEERTKLVSFYDLNVEPTVVRWMWEWLILLTSFPHDLLGCWDLRWRL